MPTLAPGADLSKGVDTGFLPLQSSPTDEKIGIRQMTSGRRVTGIQHHSAVAA
jgi:hypothetical protein